MSPDDNDDDLPTPLPAQAPGRRERRYFDEEPSDAPAARRNGRAAPGHAMLEGYDMGVLTLTDPRQWLLGNSFCRQFVSGLISAGAGGKTSLRIAQLLALAANRNITGEHIFPPGGARVLLVCFEDGIAEIRRRLSAAMKHFGVAHAEILGRFFVATPKFPLSFAEYDAKRRIAPGPLDGQVRQFIDAHQIDVVSIDPIRKAHRLKENDNDAMEAIVSILSNIAIEKNVAVDFLAHERKGPSGVGPEAGDVDRMRGGGALKDGGRLIYTITSMSKEDAEQLAINEEQRRNYFRVDSAKVNLCPATVARWFRIASVSLENGSATYPSGDIIPVAEPFQPLDGFTGLGADQFDAIVAAVGNEQFRRYSDARNPAWIVRPAAKAIGLDCENKSDVAVIQKAVAALIRAGRLIEVTALSEQRKPKVFIRKPNDINFAPPP